MALTLFSSVVFSPPAVSEANSASENPERYKPPLGKVTKIIIILSTGIGLIVIGTIILVVTVKNRKQKERKDKIR